MRSTKNGEGGGWKDEENKGYGEVWGEGIGLVRGVMDCYGKRGE